LGADNTGRQQRQHGHDQHSTHPGGHEKPPFALRIGPFRKGETEIVGRGPQVKANGGRWTPLPLAAGAEVVRVEAAWEDNRVEWQATPGEYELLPAPK
jgi:hypothetical protein